MATAFWFNKSNQLALVKKGKRTTVRDTEEKGFRFEVGQGGHTALSIPFRETYFRPEEHASGHQYAQLTVCLQERGQIQNS